MYFQEIYYQEPGKRVFDVWVEGGLVADNVDIFKEVGFMQPLLITTTAFVSDGYMTIALSNEIENPKISAIKIFDIRLYQAPTSAPTSSMAPSEVPSISPAPTTMAPSISSAPTGIPTTIAPSYSTPLMETIRINCGRSTNYTDANGRIWQADTDFGSGGTYEQYNGDEDTEIYGSERYFNKWVHAKPFVYNIPVPEAGEIAVTLYFQENFYQENGKRVFDVLIEDVLVQDDLDIFQQVGFKNPLLLTTTVMVTDGSLTITFVPEIENPKITGIEVFDSRLYVAPTVAPTVSMVPSASPSISPAPTTLAPSISSAPTVSPTTVLERVFDPIYINCGGNEYVSYNGEVTWLADQFYTGGSVYQDGTNEITPTLDDYV